MHEASTDAAKPSCHQKIQFNAAHAVTCMYLKFHFNRESQKFVGKFLAGLLDS